jgi:hypothetical protein
MSAPLNRLLTTLELLGSYVWGEQTSESDLDILVTFSETSGLFTFIELEQHLSDPLGVHVDLVQQGAVKPRLKPYIFEKTVSV